MGKARKEIGKIANSRLRKEGMIPANIIGKGKAQSIALDPKWLSKAWLKGKTFTLDLEGEKSQMRIHELQIEPVKRTAVHVDLMRV